MTTEQPRDQGERPERGRAVWLARLPVGHLDAGPGHRDRRFQANKLARAQGADIVGEFLVSCDEHEHLPDYVWREVLEFIGHLQADLLVVIRPDEISLAFADYYRRTEMLEAMGIGLAIWAVDGVQGETGEPTAA